MIDISKRKILSTRDGAEFSRDMDVAGNAGRSFFARLFYLRSKYILLRSIDERAHSGASEGPLAKKSGLAIIATDASAGLLQK
jgi:hypothetical protein